MSCQPKHPVRIYIYTCININMYIYIYIYIYICMYNCTGCSIDNWQLLFTIVSFNVTLSFFLYKAILGNIDLYLYRVLLCPSRSIVSRIWIWIRIMFFPIDFWHRTERVWCQQIKRKTLITILFDLTRFRSDFSVYGNIFGILLIQTKFGF